MQKNIIYDGYSLISYYTGETFFKISCLVKINVDIWSFSLAGHKEKRKQREREREAAMDVA